MTLLFAPRLVTPPGERRITVQLEADLVGEVALVADAAERLSMSAKTISRFPLKNTAFDIEKIPIFYREEMEPKPPVTSIKPRINNAGIKIKCADFQSTEYHQR